MTQQRRWFRACCRISRSIAHCERTFLPYEKKRATILNAIKPSLYTYNHYNAHIQACYDSSIAGVLRHQSSSTSDSKAFPALHRNPSRISSSVGSIYKPPGYFLGFDSEPAMLPADDEILADSIRSCIKIDEDEEDKAYKNWKDLDTGMSISFLGTGAGSPANFRSTSCTLLKLAGTNYLFDVGEGTQRQLQFTRGKGSTVHKIEKIFITHLHGDHIFGLPGLLLTLQTSCMQSDENSRSNDGQNKRKKKKRTNPEEGDYTVKIYGPPGLYNYIVSAITLSCTRLHLLKVEVYELVGGRVRRVTTPPPTARRHLQRGSPREHRFRDPFRDDYPELRHNGGNVQRLQIPCQNGVWTIQDKPPPLTREDIVSSVGRYPFATKQQDRILIRAAEVDHMPGVATFGYVIEEEEPPRNLDVAKARALGVSHKDKKYELLKHGFAVKADDGSGNTIEPHQVLNAPRKKARKVTIIGDNKGWTPQMTEIAKNSDVLVHEATLFEEDRTRGHSTAFMAGRNAKACDAKLLILNHLSPKMEADVASVVREAYNASNNEPSVLVSFDFLEVLVPWLGFGKATQAAENGSGDSPKNLRLESMVNDRS